MEFPTPKKIVSLFPEEKDKEIVFLLQKLIKLLDENNKEWWAEVLKSALKNYLTSEDKKEVAQLIIQTMCFGMGSLSDVTLYKDGKPLDEEDDELRTLRGKLYEACEQIVYSAGKNIGKNKFDYGDVLKVFLSLQEIEEKYGRESAEIAKEYQGREGLVRDLWIETDKPTWYGLHFFDEQGEMDGYLRFPEQYLESTGKKKDMNKIDAGERIRVSKDGRILGDEE